MASENSDLLDAIRKLADGFREMEAALNTDIDKGMATLNDDLLFALKSNDGLLRGIRHCYGRVREDAMVTRTLEANDKLIAKTEARHA
jgi:putative heme iron utilization protein